MKLLGQEFGCVFNASGARNISGHGYPFHQFLQPFGLRYEGSTFITKTVTIADNAGNMLLQGDGETPQEWVPRCIYVNYRHGITLNAVGLSNRGLDFYLGQGIWRTIAEPLVISFMAIGKTHEERREEDCQFVDKLQRELPAFAAPVTVQRNFSCPNVGHDTAALVSEIFESLTILQELDRPIIVKLNALVSPRQALEIAQHTGCHAICMSNTIPFGELPQRINWQKLFPNGSPLLKRGFKQAGGLSGKPLLPIVCDWIATARQFGLDKPIMACGGILSQADVRKVVQAGASAVEIGSASILRFWRVQGMIQEANKILSS